MKVLMWCQFGKSTTFLSDSHDKRRCNTISFLNKPCLDKKSSKPSLILGLCALVQDVSGGHNPIVEDFQTGVTLESFWSFRKDGIQYVPRSSKRDFISVRCQFTTGRENLNTSFTYETMRMSLVVSFVVVNPSAVFFAQVPPLLALYLKSVSDVRPVVFVPSISSVLRTTSAQRTLSRIAGLLDQERMCKREYSECDNSLQHRVIFLFSSHG